MKKKQVLSVALFFAVCYISLCIYVYQRLDDSFTQMNEGEFDMESGQDRQWFSLGCLCTEWTNDLRSHKIQLQHEYENKFMPYKCNQIRHRRSWEPDIETLHLYGEMKLKYSHLIWSHSGWPESPKHITYNVDRWRNDPLRVYIVPFSHVDAGWKKPFANYAVTASAVLKLALTQLEKNPKLRFAWAEIIFFEQWFDREITDDERTRIRRLIDNGQFEILTGGWIMPDEAVSHYEALIDQLVEGHLWLRKLNYTTRYSWALDPFGHSPTAAYLLKQAGIEGLLIQRVFYAIKEHLADRKQLEFAWRQSWDFGHESDLFTHMTPYRLYNIPYTLGPDPDVSCQFDFAASKCWSWGKYLSPQPINTTNIVAKANALLDQLRKKSTTFAHNMLLVPFGDDLRFNEEQEWYTQFGNLTMLMDYMNAQSDMNIEIKFSTVAQYMDDVRQHVKKTKTVLPVLSGDFHPYNDRTDQFWTGYYTSRPYLKYGTRMLQSRIKAAEFQLARLLARSVDEKDGAAVTGAYDSLVKARRAAALLHHHDAITGTASNTTVKSYLTGLQEAMKETGSILELTTSTTLALDAASPPPAFHMMEIYGAAHELPKTIPFIIDLNTRYRIIAVYNPLTVSSQRLVTIQVSSSNVHVANASHDHVTCQVNPILIGGELEVSSSTFEVVFMAELAAMETKWFNISYALSATHACTRADVTFLGKKHSHHMSTPFAVKWISQGPILMENQVMVLSFCSCSRLLQGVLRKKTDTVHKLSVNFATYSTGSWTEPLLDKSGAYTFIPNGPAQLIDASKSVGVMVTGPVLSSVTTRLRMTLHKVTLINSTDFHSELIHIANTVDIHTTNNLELSMQVHSDIANSRLFFTDLNGFQSYRRLSHSSMPIQGNLYPVTSHAFLEDSNRRLTLLTGQSHGVSNLRDGLFEVMLDRRLTQDDWRGLGEGVEDNLATPSMFSLLLEDRIIVPSNEPVGHLSLTAHLASSAINNPPQLLLLQQQPNRDSSKLPLRVSSLQQQQDTRGDEQFFLPCDVGMKVRPVLATSDSAQSRLANSYLIVTLWRTGLDCGIAGIPVSCKGVEEHDLIDVDSLCRAFHCKSMYETTLTGVKVLSKLTSWRIRLTPMEIRTFKLVW